MRENKTDILASKENLDLLKIFFDAHKLGEYIIFGEHKISFGVFEDDQFVSTEKFYRAISINYDEKDDVFVDVILLNLVTKNYGLNNMLIDYLFKAKSSLIVVKYTYRPPTPSYQEVNENFVNNIIPKLPEIKTKHVTRRNGMATTKITY